MPALKLKPLSEQVIVITGATSGIGLATAREAADQGAALVIAARNEDALNALAAEIRGKGGRVEPVVADVSRMEDVERISETAIAAFGGFDSWCNNAGIALYGELEDVPLEDQRRVFDVNYWGVVHGTLVATRHLKGRGGAIINIGSVLSDRAMALQGPYSAAKFAVKGVTESFRTEFDAEGYPISLTLIKPGPIDTPYMEHARNLMGTPGVRNPPPAYHPRVVARAILYACSTPVRDLVVGGGGWVVSAMGRLAPKLTDLIMSKIAKPSQSSEQPGREQRRDNMYEPREDLAETSSLDGPPPRRTSFLLEAQMNPLGPAGLMLGAAALLAGAALGVYTLRRQEPAPKRLSDRAWRYGRSLAHEARHGIGSLGGGAGRIAHRAWDYADHAGRGARPYLRQARKEGERFADRARRYASSFYDDARERGDDLYEGARDRGRAYYRDLRGRGEDAYDDARDRGWSLFGRARDRGEEAYDEARDRGWHLFKRARAEGRDAYDDARDRGWSLFGRARDRGEEAYDEARDRGWHLFKRARAEGRDTYDDARDRGWSLFGRARDRGEEAYDDARDRGWHLFKRARAEGRDTYDDARDRGWSLFGHARHEAERRGRHAAEEGESLLERVNAFLKSRL
ncbi:SDR family NAD(P)-dependent oxidoreductase [Roseomonas sp. SSH11]|uniref:SDR family NAD(P)-dependent oxidoreductase n=1 Tax=Pararoseomonas baculiformis TaxID=2820812 RepID=A0ABS4AHT7_9PROT|nr:SDR family oxidoreductase [Pararoseomonas baculiformis]MBP0446586.1 SDR family NAD(P)-dependent oxidoreductase [Pararoseomonas baculiformis]